jgi:hypothetical protein
MWLQTVYGWFSVVCDHTGTKVIPGKVLIRARVKSHLLDLLKAFPELRPEDPPVHLPGRDYAWRIRCAKADWVKVAGRLAEDVNYTNFKNAVHELRPEDMSYIHALHETWRVGMDMQNTTHDVGRK